jgi:hypothetical protein
MVCLSDYTPGSYTSYTSTNILKIHISLFYIENVLNSGIETPATGKELYSVSPPTYICFSLCFSRFHSASHSKEKREITNQNSTTAILFIKNVIIIHAYVIIVCILDGK